MIHQGRGAAWPSAGRDGMVAFRLGAFRFTMPEHRGIARDAFHGSRVLNIILRRLPQPEIMKVYDVIIVGAGPAGSALAIHLASSGYAVALLDRERFPRDKVCGDLVSARGLGLLRELDCFDAVVQKPLVPIRDANVFFDGQAFCRGRIPRIPGLPPHGHAIPRLIFDEILLRRAQAAGAETIEDCRVSGFDTDRGGVTVSATLSGRSARLFGRMIVGADGAQSIVAKTAGLEMRDPRYVLPALRTYCHGLPLEQALLCFEEDFFPGYAWIFPISEGLANIGVGMVQETLIRHRLSLKDFYRRLERFVHRLAAEAGVTIRLDKPAGWPIKSYGSNRRNHFERGLLIGEAGCFVDALTGEGIPLALDTARIARNAIDRAFARGTFDAAELAGYDRNCRAVHHADLKISDLVVSIARNRHSRDLSMHALKLMGMTANHDEGYALTLGGIMAGLVPARQGLSAEIVLKSLVHGPEFWLRAFEIRPEHTLSDLMAAGIRVGGWQARMLQGLVAEPRWHRDWLLELQGKGLEIARTLVPELGGRHTQHPAAEPATDLRSRRHATVGASPAEGRRRALVLGATGHIGSAVVRELLERGWEVTATSRRPMPTENLAGLPIRFETAHGDIPGDFDHRVAGQDLVVDAGAPYPVHRFVSPDRWERQPVDHAVRRTRALLEAVRRHGARLAYIGSFTTTPRRFSPLRGWQSHLLRRLHPYFEVKQRMEDLILAASRNGLPSVVVNPTVCIGPWDLKRREHCLIPQLLSGEVPGFVRHELNVIDVRDVAAAVLAAVDAESYGDPIPLSGHNVSTDSLVQRICELGRGPAPPRLRLPARLTLAAALSTEALLGLAGRQSPSPALATMLLAESHWTSPEGIQNALGIWPRPLSRTLVDAIDWYRQLGYC